MKARSFVVIMIVVALVTLLLRFIVLQIVRINIEQNESNAQTALKLLSTALENYAKDHQGVFPDRISALTQNQSPYLSKDYLSLSPIGGYSFVCSKLNAAGYNCAARPVNCDLTGRNIYIATTGSVFISEKCGGKKD